MKLKGNLFSRKKLARKRAVFKLKKSLKFRNVNSMVCSSYSSIEADILDTAPLGYVQYYAFTFGLTSGSSGGVYTLAPSVGGEISALYDMYKLNKVVIKFIPTNNVTDPFSSLNNQSTAVTSNTSQGAFIGIHSVIDYNDSTVPQNITELTEYSSYRYTRAGAIHIRTFTPKVQTSLTNGVTTFNRPLWIKTTLADGITTTNTQHYCLKMALDNIDNVGWDVPETLEHYYIKWNVHVKYYFQLKNNK